MFLGYKGNMRGELKLSTTPPIFVLRLHTAFMGGLGGLPGKPRKRAHGLVTRQVASCSLVPSGLLGNVSHVCILWFSGKSPPNC